MTSPPETAKPPSRGDARVEGILEKILFRGEDGGFAVGALALEGGAGAITVRGNLLGAQLGERLRIVGEWIEHPQYGWQVKARSVEVVPPSDLDGLRAYLGSGLVKGIGPAKAAAIVGALGLNAIATIETNPRALERIPGIGKRRAAAIATAVREQKGLRELVAFLGAQSVGAGTAQRIWTHYGADALRFVRHNPYRLADDVWGFGFRKADEIAGKLGMAPDAPERMRAGLLFALNDAAGEGHACVPKIALVERAARLLEVDEEPVRAAFEVCVKENSLVLEPGPVGEDAEDPVFLPTLLAAERAVAQQVKKLLAAKLPPPIADASAIDAAATRAKIRLHPQQRAAIASALRERLLVVTGGPGVGKTTITRLVVDLAVARGRVVLLGSPTGRAARRLAEATGKPASTLHRLLDFQPRTGAFLRDERRPLEADLVIVDEASMIDVQLAAHLFRALTPPTRLILVGDADQLPSVGPGSVLRDLLASEIAPVARLTHVFRQGAGSAIVAGAHRILAGEMPEFSESASGDGDFFFIEREDPLDALNTVAHVVTERIPARYGLDPRLQVQVIAPMYRGEVGVDRLNRELRARLNPTGPSFGEGDRLLRVGDRVLATRNDAEREIFNGDVGSVARIDSAARTLTVDFGDRRVVFEESRARDLVPAYAISVHRAQGSEYTAVVVPLSTQHFVMLRRTLLYTAITRARRVCVLVGSHRALEIAVRDARGEERWTRLKERLRA